MARATRISFLLLGLVYVGAIVVLVGVVPWTRAGVTQSPFVTLFQVAKIPAAGFVMNLIVLWAALSGANATLYVASRMMFSLARSGYAPKQMGSLNVNGVPMAALLASMLGIVAAILLQLRTPNAYLYIINASLIGGMLAWLVSLAAHVRFRNTLTLEQRQSMPLRSPLGSIGSVAAFIAIIAAIICTAKVDQSQVAAYSFVGYVVILSLAYFAVKPARRGAGAPSSNH